MMYDDYPDWKVYLNAMKAMYYNNSVKIDIVGTIESISKIDKEILYKCYNTFYNPGNMVMVICGDFEPEKLLEEIKKRLLPSKTEGKIQRIYPEEPEKIVKEEIEQKIDVSQPIYTIGIKDTPPDFSNKISIVRKEIAIQILLDIMLSDSSNLYKKLYNEGIVFGGIGYNYEFSGNYAHVLISGQSVDPEKVYKELKKEIRKLKEEGINKEDFERIRKKTYGGYIEEYNDVSNIARMFLLDYFKGVNSFDYLEEIENINVEFLNQVLKDVFKEDKMVISIVRN